MADAGVAGIRNLEVDGYPSKENLFVQTVLLMNVMYVIFS